MYFTVSHYITMWGLLVAISAIALEHVGRVWKINMNKGVAGPKPKSLHIYTEYTEKCIIFYLFSIINARFVSGNRLNCFLMNETTWFKGIIAEKVKSLLICRAYSDIVQSVFYCPQLSKLMCQACERPLAKLFRSELEEYENVSHNKRCYRS